MADVDTSDRASRFDRADFSSRQALPQRQKTQQLLQALAPAAREEGQAAIAMSEPDPTEDLPIATDETNAAQNPSGDELLTAEHLKSAGWSQTEIQTILSGPGHPDAPTTGSAASQAQVEAHLRALGWTNSDIARLLVGPEESHLTAESVFRQHAANPARHQEVLVKAMAQSGAKKVQTDPSLLAGIDAAHLGPGTPTDVEQIIARFAELPDVQKQRFLMLLNSQNQDKSKKANLDGSSKKSDAGSDILPIVKGGLDLLSTTLKELLGSTKGGSKKDNKGGSGSGSTNNWYESQDDESDQGDGGDQGDKSDEGAQGDEGDQDDSYEGPDDSEEDPALTGEEWDSSSPSDGSESIDFDSETGID